MGYVHKIDTVYLDSPRRELSNIGLGIVVTLLVFFRELSFRSFLDKLGPHREWIHTFHRFFCLFWES